MQEVQLDSHVKLLDCPGIVMATDTTDTQIILRNAVKVRLFWPSKYDYFSRHFS